MGETKQAKGPPMVRRWYVRATLDKVVEQIVYQNYPEAPRYKRLWAGLNKPVDNLWQVTEKQRDQLKAEFIREGLRYEFWTSIGGGYISRWIPKSKLGGLARGSKPKLTLIKGGQKYTISRQ